MTVAQRHSPTWQEKLNNALCGVKDRVEEQNKCSDKKREKNKGNMAKKRGAGCGEKLNIYPADV